MRIFQPIACLLLALACGIPLGCTTYYGQGRNVRMAQEREDVLLMEDRLQRIEGRLEGVEMTSDNLRRDWDFDRQDRSRMADSETAYLKQRIEDLERRLEGLEVARERDKQEIIDRISANVSQVISKSTPAVRSSSRSSSGYGYEHLVEAGQTLSEIASAYETTVQAILEENNIENANQIRVGQKLFIPE